jgi:DNA primase
MPHYLTMKGINYRQPFRCINPAHQDNKPSMHYADFLNGKPWYKIRCFSCCACYDIFDLVKQDFNLKNMREAAFKIAEIFSLDIDGQTRTGTDSRAVPPAPAAPVPPIKEYMEYDITERIAQAHANVGRTDYYMARGFSPSIINEYKLGYWAAGYNDFVQPISTDLSYKLLQQRHYTYIIPIMDAEGKPRNFIARMNENGTMDDYNPKTLNMKGVQMHFLNERYMENPAQFLKGATHLFIVEGWADALSIEQAGGRAIALNTTSSVERFMRLCAAHADELKGITIVGGGDRDHAGQIMNRMMANGIPDHDVLSIPEMGLRFMPFNMAGNYKDANEFLCKEPDSFHGIVTGVIENRLGRFRKDHDMDR